MKASLPLAIGSTAPFQRETHVSDTIRVLHIKRVSTQGTPPLITTETATQARRAWWAVWEATGFALPVPAASSGPNGEMFYSWDRGRHHLELEIISRQPAEFFYRNRVTGELWGADYIIGDPIPVDAINKLKLFI